MSDDDRAVMAKLAALEAEVKAKTDADRARKDAALAKLREQRAKQQAESSSLRERQAAMVTKKKPAPAVTDDDDAAGDSGDQLGGALELAKRAHGVKQELARPGAKSWKTAGLASLVLGPIGWLYAGSFREAVPASAAWLAFGALASKIIPMFLLMPVLMVVLPLSAIAGIVYATQYNKKGSRQRLFGKKQPKQLPGGSV